IGRRGEPARVRTYQHVILTWGLFATLVLFMWLLLGRSWPALGFKFPSLQHFLIGSVLAIGFICLIALPLRKLSRSSNGAAQLVRDTRDFMILLPRSRLEESWFKRVSVNAGITEELIYRGYLLWYLQHFVTPWLAAVLGVALFTVAHMYQGIKQMPGIALTSAITVALFMLTDSLLVPVLFHVFLDLAQGHYIARIYRASEAPKSNEVLT
ncbi:MAG: CPBP family intramembrane glutamic endopeptidase, partial [Pseudomonadales bacterium]